MQENKENPNELLELLLEKCDRQYQEIQLLKGKLEDRTDVDALKSSYEKTLSEKDTRIVDLEKQVAYLRRRIWGKSSERYIQADPQQRRIDFDGLDLLPGEIELAEAARVEIEAFRERRVKERVKRKPVRKPLPEDLPRVEEHLYPAEISDNKDAWTELEPEITEVLEYEPGKCYVRKIVRHKYVLKNKPSRESGEESSPIVTASLPTRYQPVARSYAGASLLAELMIRISPGRKERISGRVMLTPSWLPLKSGWCVNMKRFCPRAR